MSLGQFGPRLISEIAGVSAQRRPAGPLFRVCQKWCCADSPLGANARHVLVQIARRMDADAEGRQVAFIGEKKLVEDTGLSLSTVRRAVRELREAGVIKTSPGGVTRGHRHRCNEFEIIG